MPLVRFLLSACLLLGLFGARVNAEELGLYEGEVAVASQSESDRIAALPAALAHVLAKMGGQGASAEIPSDVDPVSLLQQYRYRQQTELVDGVAQTRQHLIARFDQKALQGLLASNTSSVWPVKRPQPILWLAIDDGSGVRMVSQAAAAAVVSLTSRAVQRGYKIRLPNYDEQDQGIVQARDLTSEESYSVDQATKRYGGPALIGWLRRGEGGWVADWRLREGDTEIHRWRSEDGQATTVLASGADGAADALISRYSRMLNSGPAGNYKLVVEGVDSAEDYARVVDLLKRQPNVRELSAQVLTGDRLELNAQLSSGVEGLARLLDGSGLEPQSVGDAKTETVFSLGR